MIIRKMENKKVFNKRNKQIVRLLIIYGIMLLLFSNIKSYKYGKNI